jgi:hypothetical protein
MQSSPQPAANESSNDALKRLFPGVEMHVMTTVVANMTDEQRKTALHEETTLNGKVYQIVWVEKGDWEADGKHWDTMLRLFFVRATET